MGSWNQRKAKQSEASQQANYNDFSSDVVKAYASVLTHLSDAQIRMILERTNGVDDSETTSS